jgi:hypothetical protein
MFKVSMSNKFKQMSLDIYGLILVEISRNFQLYKKQQSVIFRSILDLIDQLDSRLTYNHKIKRSYFNTYKILFVVLIIHLNIDLTINKRIYEIY